jgi:hypothetical protein
MNAYLAAEVADYVQHERLEAARLARLAADSEPRPIRTGSLRERVVAVFRPAPEPCPTT